MRLLLGTHAFLSAIGGSHVRALKAKVLPVEFAHSVGMLSLPMHHRGPFDRMLIAQTRAEGLTVVTRDAAFGLYEVPVVW